MADTVKLPTYEALYDRLLKDQRDWLDTAIVPYDQPGVSEDDLVTQAARLLADQYKEDMILQAVTRGIINNSVLPKSNKDFPYTAEALASLYGYSGDKEHTKVQNMVADFGDKDKTLGMQESALAAGLDWDLAKKAIVNASLDQMDSDIRAGREAIMEGHDPDKGIIGQAVDWLASAVMGLGAPRVKEDVIENGDWKAKDLLLDAAENIALSVPGPAWVAAPAKVVAAIPKVGSKAVGKAARYLSDLDRKLGEGRAANLGRTLAGFGRNMAGNTVAPALTEAMDAAAYDTDDYMDNRATFSPSDVIMGGLVNQAVNRGLFRQATPMVLGASGDISRSKSVATVRDFLEHLGEDAAAMGDDYANKVRHMADIELHKDGTLNPTEYRAARQGRNNTVPAVTPEQYEEAARAQTILDAIDNGDLEITKGNKTFRAGYDKKKNNNTSTAKNATSTEKAEANQGMAESQAHYTLMEYIAENASDPETVAKALDHMDAATKKQKESVDKLYKAHKSAPTSQANAMASSNLQPAEYLSGYPSFGDELDISKLLQDKDYARLLTKPEIVNYAVWHGQGEGKASRTEKILNVLNQVVPTFAVNRLGKDEYAKSILQSFDKTGLLEKARQADHAQPKVDRLNARVDKAMDGDLTEQDRKYLAAIKSNPDILTYGYKEDPNGFKAWLLRKGNDLLRDTHYFRATPSVQ